MAEKKGYVATTKFLIASPTKVRPVANVIKRKTCSEALAILDVMPQKGAGLISGTLKSAVANALFANKNLDEDIWELRPGNNRVLYFYFRDNKFVLLHQFRKKTQKTPGAEMPRAFPSGLT